MKKNTIVASVVATFVATAASAGSLVVPVADPVIVVAPTPAASLWDGFYAGATLGWNTGEWLDHTITGSPATAFDGMTYGGFIGYNYVMDGGFMVGAELAGTIVNMDDGFGTWDITVFDAKLRAGFEMDRALVYASGGYSTYIDGGGLEGNGWNAGAGIDYLVTDSVFVGAEYVYRDITDTLGAPDWEDQYHTFQIRAGIKF